MIIKDITVFDIYIISRRDIFRQSEVLRKRYFALQKEA
nr:MAG TPA: hypothetical protein [Caudoviricetes sp.]